MSDNKENTMVYDGVALGELTVVTGVVVVDETSTLQPSTETAFANQQIFAVPERFTRSLF